MLPNCVAHITSLVTGCGRLGKRHVTTRMGHRDLNTLVLALSWLCVGKLLATSRGPVFVCLVPWLTQPHGVKEASCHPSLSQKGDVCVAQQWDILLDFTLSSLLGQRVRSQP